MTGPLAGVRVFVPRAPDRAEPLVAALRSAGATPVLAPLVEIGAPRDPGPMSDAVARLTTGGFDWVAVTSTFAVVGLRDAAGRRGLTLADAVAAGQRARPGSTRVAAVGDATAAALARAGVVADFVPADAQSARGMLAEWPAAQAGASVLLPQSDLAEPTLAAGLTARGLRPETVVAYTNSPAAPLSPELLADLASGAVGAVVLTSGSAARRLVAQVGLPPSTTVCCLGPRTAEVAASLGLPASVVATTPSPTSIVAALSGALGAHAPSTEPNPEHPDPKVSA